MLLIICAVITLWNVNLSDTWTATQWKCSFQQSEELHNFAVELAVGMFSVPFLAVYKQFGSKKSDVKTNSNKTILENFVRASHSLTAK